MNIDWQTIAGANFTGDLNHWVDPQAFFIWKLALAMDEDLLAKRTMLPFKAIDGVLLAKMDIGQNRYELRWWCATRSDGTWLPLTEIETQLVPFDEMLASVTEHIIVLTVFKNGDPSFHRSAESRHFANRTHSEPNGKMLLRKLLNLT